MEKKMKKGEVHPKYQQVLFVDSSTGSRFVCGSSFQSEQKEKFEGKEYPVCVVSVSSYSHPLFTGSKQLIDVEGRVDRFLNKYKKKTPAVQASQEKPEDESKGKKGKPPEEEKKEKKTPRKKA